MQNEIELNKSILHELISLIQFSLNKMGVSLPNLDAETLGVTIYTVMEARWRKYHSIDHVLSICQSQDEIQIIAGLFHDVVYLQIDRRIPPRLAKYLHDFKNISDNYTITIPSNQSDSSSKSLHLVSEIFGLSSGQTLTPSTGANEFLSALVATRILENYLSPWNLIQIISCIELTIPFRPKNHQGKSALEQLENRLKKMNNSLFLDHSEKEIQKTMNRAVELANRDLISFSYEKTLEFLNQTWNLILEGNPVFKNPMFTISQYRLALQKVEKFFSFLDPKLIFYRYECSDFNNQIYEKMFANSKKNLSLGIEFFQIKLITMGVIEAIAELTGGDAPLVLFSGQASGRRKDNFTVMEHFLDLSLPEVSDPDINPITIKLLNNMLFDALNPGKKTQTMSSYLYVRISKFKQIEIYNKMVLFFDGKIQPFDILKCFDKKIIYSIIHALENMATTRQNLIHVLKNKIC